MFIFIILFINYVVSTTAQQCNTTFICGNATLRYPFWRLNDTTSDYCGYPDLGINCTNQNPILTVDSRPYMLNSVNYTKNSFIISHVEFMGHTCPSPRHNYSLSYAYPYLSFGPKTKWLTFFTTCASYPPSVSYISCLGSNATNRSFVFLEERVPNFNWYGNCEKSFRIPVLDTAINTSNTSNTYDMILQGGFQLQWYIPNSCRDCQASGGQCAFNRNNTASVCFCSNGEYVSGTCDIRGKTLRGDVWTKMVEKKKIMIGVSMGVGSFILIMLFVLRRKIISFSHLIYGWSNIIRNNRDVEVFLESYAHFAPHRYTYSDLKRITNCFKEKLGQGGYGGVFKGKLNDGHIVAVKILNATKGNGEDFINEVATIGRTNHINVVSLIGFCSEGSKRALVYEFMPNGSLEKFIHNEKGTRATQSLGFEKLYQIALGIANGLEYLHRGCNTRIFHFDIKPHNILLDHDFCPKISDFGLAKLCPTNESIVSMSNARGTVGYIAPEVYYRNFGGVSSKSDVYSYGVMVLEMIGGRRNIGTTTENTSAIYFPQWVYNQLEQQESIESEEFGEMLEEGKIKKMIIVGLWCIQIHPTNRPSMSMVVEMLQKNVEDLEMPPKPSLHLFSNVSFGNIHELVA